MRALQTVACTQNTQIHRFQQSKLSTPFASCCQHSLQPHSNWQTPLTKCHHARCHQCYKFWRYASHHLYVSSWFILQRLDMVFTCFVRDWMKIGAAKETVRKLRFWCPISQSKKCMFFSKIFLSVPSRHCSKFVIHYVQICSIFSCEFCRECRGLGGDALHSVPNGAKLLLRVRHTRQKNWMCTMSKEQARARGENANAQTRNNSSDLKERSRLLDVLTRLRWSPPDGQSETELYWILICGRWSRSHFCNPQARTELKAFECGAAHVAWSKQNSPKANHGP